jgi:diguanylate cyclase (GGDEF)-like protein
MCDIDLFKKVNDRYSHTVGDKVLKRMAGIMKDAARTTDLVIRYGGEEFLLILPDTDRTGAAVVTERIRTRVSAHEWSDIAEGLSLTLSIGVSELGPNDDGAALIAASDAKLYEAKRAGRDRVVA